MTGCGDEEVTVNNGGNNGGEDTSVEMDAGDTAADTGEDTADEDTEDQDTGDPGDTGGDTGMEDTGAEDTGSEDTGSEDTGMDTGTEDTGAEDTGMDAGDTGIGDTGMDADDTVTDDTGMDAGDTGINDTGLDSGDTGTDSGDTAFDTGVDSGQACGNDTVEGTEVCDGTDLNGETCVTQGFASGTLACDASCSDFDTSGCTSSPTPGTGDLVITEIMQNPDATSDADGEYLEILNTSGATDYNLNGCELTGKANESPISITVNLVATAGQFITIASSSSPGFTPDHVEAGLTLSNGVDQIAVECPDGSGGTVVVDEVLWDDGSVFPDPSGASMNLTDEATATDATENDNGYWWCETPTNDLGNGDLGTPGMANEVCPTTPIEYCRLQDPATVTAPENTQETFYGRLYIAGITDQSMDNDTRQFFEVEMGYGPDGTDPENNASWEWASAGVNPAWTGSGQSADEDEYQSTITLPAAANSPYDTAFRFSGDYGRTWQYCDTVDGGANFSYDISEAGNMTTTQATAGADLFLSEYIEGSSNNKGIELYNPDTAPQTLGSCELRIYANGSSTPTSTISPGITDVIANEGTFTICSDQAGPGLTSRCDLTSGSVNFNGNDAVELLCNGATLDVIGQIGTDPGASWSANGVSTQNETLRRDCSITTGDTDGTDAFDPSLEWNSFAQDSFGDFGDHCP